MPDKRTVAVHAFREGVAITHFDSMDQIERLAYGKVSDPLLDRTNLIDITNHDYPLYAPFNEVRLSCRDANARTD